MTCKYALEQPTVSRKKEVDLGLNEQDIIDQLRQVLNEAGASYTIHIHDETVASVQKGVDMELGELRAMAPTLILSTQAGYVAAIISGETRLSYKKIKKELRLRDVSLATPEQVQQVTGAHTGNVALINPGIRTIVDTRLTEQSSIYGGCGIPCYSLQISIKDLIAVTYAEVFDFTELKAPIKDH